METNFQTQEFCDNYYQRYLAWRELMSWRRVSSSSTSRRTILTVWLCMRSMMYCSGPAAAMISWVRGSLREVTRLQQSAVRRAWTISSSACWVPRLITNTSPPSTVPSASTLPPLLSVLVWVWSWTLLLLELFRAVVMVTPNTAVTLTATIIQNTNGREIISGDPTLEKYSINSIIHLETLSMSPPPVPLPDVADEERVPEESCPADDGARGLEPGVDLGTERQVCCKQTSHFLS